MLDPGDYVCLEVVDTGSGIAQDILDHIFEPFFTTKFTGRGLGLAAVLGIVRGHGGSILIRAEQGKGTCFELAFPRTSRVSSLRTQSVAPCSPLLVGFGTVLLVDDEPPALRATSRLLRQMGFKVAIARDGQEALNLVEQLGPELSCVILDMTMPTMGGIPAMTQIQRSRPGLPVILSSGYSLEQVDSSLGQHKPAAFLYKPYDYDGLNRALSKVLLPSPRSKLGSE